jgi:sugar phosphate isomerase/epimerase
MAKVSGFIDEVSKELDEQVSACKSLGLRYVALRGCFGKNVMDWSPEECGRIKQALDSAGVGVSEIGSPIGKTAIDEPFEQTQAALAHAVELAKLFVTPNIRMFSFYPPAAGPADEWRKKFRGEVLSRLARMAAQVESAPVVLMLENESDLYGDQPAECLDIMQNVRSPKLAMAFDFANFVSRSAIDVYNDAWQPLRKYVRHIHIKDHVPGAKTACPAGEGIGKVPEILADLARENYAGFLTLEPHLSKAERFQGFSGLDKFKVAADALAGICRRVGMKIG